MHTRLAASFVLRLCVQVLGTACTATAAGISRKSKSNATADRSTTAASAADVPQNAATFSKGSANGVGPHKPKGSCDDQNHGCDNVYA